MVREEDQKMVLLVNLAGILLCIGCDIRIWKTKHM